MCGDLGRKSDPQAPNIALDILCSVRYLLGVTPDRALVRHGPP
jgi:hypothetical protein